VDNVLDAICITNHNSWMTKSTTIHHGRYEWDAAKASANMREHGHHRGTEERWQLIGFSAQARLLVVVHCERDGDRIRIISARRANRSDAHKYARRSD
jgi:uncharacterized protein